MATLNDLIITLRNQIGDNDPLDQNITDDEISVILNNAANEYSRIKSYIKIDETQVYDKNTLIYALPNDCYKVKSVEITGSKYSLSFIDNTDQIYLRNSPDIEPTALKITYTRYFLPEEVIQREVDLYLLYAEALCYKLLSIKTAALFKFTTGEKVIDEDNISKKYLQLYQVASKNFRDRVIKAYGARVNNLKENMDYPLPYPIEGENP